MCACVGLWVQCSSVCLDYLLCNLSIVSDYIYGVNYIYRALVGNIVALASSLVSCPALLYRDL
jgi:hypothetical protein